MKNKFKKRYQHFKQEVKISIKAFNFVLRLLNIWKIIMKHGIGTHS